MTKQSATAGSHDKLCTLCHIPRSVLVRCQIDESGKWHFVCPGKCWTSVSGGEIDAKGHKSEFPYYRYGGMWKNRHEDGPLHAKKPKKVKAKPRRSLSENHDASDASNEVEDTETKSTEEQNETSALAITAS